MISILRAKLSLEWTITVALKRGHFELTKSFGQSLFIFFSLYFKDIFHFMFMNEIVRTTEQVSVAVTSQTCIREVLGLNPGSDTD